MSLRTYFGKTRVVKLVVAGLFSVLIPNFVPTAAQANTCSPATTSTVDIYTVLKFTSTTTCNWTVPTGVTSIDVFMVGGGGGGGADGGGGGGGGAAISRSAFAVTAGSSLALTVGTGGAPSTWTSGYAGDNGTASTLVRTSPSTTLTANGGTKGGMFPTGVAGAGGIAVNGGFAGGLGGASSGSANKKGGDGASGISNYFYGTKIEYGGGGGGGSYYGANSFTESTGKSGGGNGGASGPGNNQPGNPGLANTGGGGGGGSANSPQQAGGRGADGVILIRYATSASDSFPSSLSSSLSARFSANDLQVLDTSRKSWIDSSGQNASIANSSFRGTPTIAVQGTTDSGFTVKSSKSLLTAAGTTADGVTLPNLPTNYTLFHVARYQRGGSAGRIVSSANGDNWLSGFWAGNQGVMYHQGWATSYTTGTDYSWQLSTDQKNLYRSNGIDISSDGYLGYDATNFGINMGYASTEYSTWQLVDMLIFNRQLGVGEIASVETYLSRVYGLTINSRAVSSETDTALVLSGGNNYLYHPKINPSENLNDTFTVQAWVKPSSTCSSYRCGIFNRENTLVTSLYAGTFWYALYGANSTWEWTDTGVQFPADEWHHVTITKRLAANTNNSLDVYRDGILVYTKSGNPYRQSTASVTYSATDIVYPGINGSVQGEITYIGTRAGGDSFYGRLDEIKVWKVSRTASEILNDMHSSDASNSNLQMYYDFNRDSPSSSANISNLVNSGPARSDLKTGGGSSITYEDVKSVSSSGAYTKVTFPRTYITQYGGWKAASSQSASALIVAGGGGGGGGGYVNSFVSAAGGGGGGGAGELRIAVTPLSAGTIYPIKVGMGGPGGSGGNTSAWNGWDGSSGQSSEAFSNVAAAGAGGRGGGWDTSNTWTDGTGGSGGASGNGNSGGSKSSTVGTGGGGGGGTISSGTAASSSTGANGGEGQAHDYSGTSTTYSSGGRGGNGSTTSATGATGQLVSANLGYGGNGGQGSKLGTTGSGSSGSSGVVIVRWITASVPSYTKPTNANLNVGMTETFTVNVAADSATAQLTRTFKWESSTAGAAGPWTVIKQGTGASNAFFAWIPPDTSTSGSNFLYRLTVTDSDTAGLFITDSSTAYATINGALILSGISTINKTINSAKTETFTVSSGTPTYRYTLSPTVSGITIDSSTVGYPRIVLAETLTVGTYLETLTVTDSVSATYSLPLRITVAGPPTLSNGSDVVTTGQVFHIDTGNSASVTPGNVSSGTTGIRDISGGGHTVTVAGSTLSFNDDYGGYLTLNDSTTAYTSYTNYLQFTKRSSLTSWTLEGYFKLNTTLSAGTCLITNEYTASGNGVNINYALCLDSGRTFYAGFHNGNWTYKRTSTVLNVGTWYHLAATYSYDASTCASAAACLNMYLNGELVSTISGSASSAGTTPPAADTNKVFVGRYLDSRYSYLMPMSLGVARIYDVALSQTQIQQNFSATKARFTTANQDRTKPSQKHNTTSIETFTVTSGGDTRTITFAVGNRTGIEWNTSDTSTVQVTIKPELTVGTYYDTVTVTDNLGGSSFLPVKITINKGDQAKLSIGQYNAFVGVSSYPINVYGGSGTGAVTRTLTNAGTAGCALASGMFLSAARVGSCSVQAVKATDANFLAETATATIYWIQWSDAYATRAPSTPTEIVLNHETAITKYNYDTLTVTSYQNSSGVTITSISTGAVLRIIGDGFSPTAAYTEVVFASMDAVDLTSGLQVVSSGGSNYLQLTIPSGATTGIITVNSPKGTAVGPSLTITP